MASTRCDAGQDQELGADLSVLHARQGVSDCGVLLGQRAQGRGHEDYASAEADARRAADTLQGMPSMLLTLLSVLWRKRAQGG